MKFPFKTSFGGFFFGIILELFKKITLVISKLITYSLKYVKKDMYLYDKKREGKPFIFNLMCMNRKIEMKIFKVCFLHVSVE